MTGCQKTESQFAEAMFLINSEGLAHDYTETEYCSLIPVFSVLYSKRASQSLAGHVTAQNMN